VKTPYQRKTGSMNEPLLTVEEVAQRLRLDVEVVRRYLRRGELAGMRFGNRGGWRISEADLAAFLAARRAAAERAAQRTDE
jgi:excisionase family DNA binding protein